METHRRSLSKSLLYRAYTIVLVNPVSSFVVAGVVPSLLSGHWSFSVSLWATVLGGLTIAEPLVKIPTYDIFERVAARFEWGYRADAMMHHFAKRYPVTFAKIAREELARLSKGA
jgi:hypothetical protein